MSTYTERDLWGNDIEVSPLWLQPWVQAHGVAEVAEVLRVALLEDGGFVVCGGMGDRVYRIERGNQGHPVDAATTGIVCDLLDHGWLEYNYGASLWLTDREFGQPVHVPLVSRVAYRQWEHEQARATLRRAAELVAEKRAGVNR